MLQQNAADGGNRRFILVEMDAEIASKITAERLKLATQGYSYRDQRGNEKAVEGLGGGFRYCEQGQPLFDSDGQIRSEVTFDDLVRHVYFTETGQPLPSPTKNRVPVRNAVLTPLLGIHNGVAIYLLYNAILKDKSPGGGNVLTRPQIAKLPPHDGPKVIYAASSLISENKLRQMNIVFKQVPYEIKVN